MTGEEITAIAKVAAAYQGQGHRAGQSLFIACYWLCPEIADKACGTDVDPFYDDSLIGAFYNYLMEA